MSEPVYCNKVQHLTGHFSQLLTLRCSTRSPSVSIIHALFGSLRTLRSDCLFSCRHAQASLTPLAATVQGARLLWCAVAEISQCKVQHGCAESSELASPFSHGLVFFWVCSLRLIPLSTPFALPWRCSQTRRRWKARACPGLSSRLDSQGLSRLGGCRVLAGACPTAQPGKSSTRSCVRTPVLRRRGPAKNSRRENCWRPISL